MLNTRKKLVKDKGAAPTELDQDSLVRYQG